MKPARPRSVSGTRSAAAAWLPKRKPTGKHAPPPSASRNGTVTSVSAFVTAPRSSPGWTFMQ